MSRPSLKAGAAAVGAGAFVLYLATLAPTVLWGDDAELQRRAFTGEIAPGLRGHPLWVVVAHLFTRLPIGDVAFRANLLCAFFAAIAVGLTFAAAWTLTRSASASAIAAGALGVSHTF